MCISVNRVFGEPFLPLCSKPSLCDAGAETLPTTILLCQLALWEHLLHGKDVAGRGRKDWFPSVCFLRDFCSCQDHLSLLSVACRESICHGSLYFPQHLQNQPRHVPVPGDVPSHEPLSSSETVATALGCYTGMIPTSPHAQPSG